MWCPPSRDRNNIASAKTVGLPQTLNMSNVSVFFSSFRLPFPTSRKNPRRVCLG